MVSRSDVISAYRHILRRDPESEVAIAHHTGFGTTEDLYAAIVGSAEFRDLYVGVEARAPRSVGSDGPPLDVEVSTTGDKLEKLSRIVEKTWTGLGVSEPYWSVITNDAYRREAFVDNADEFAGSGKADLDRLAAFTGRSGIDLARVATCFELGCGVGRVTQWLAQRFAKVIAADISKPHLDIARLSLERRGIDNVSFLRLAHLEALKAITGFDLFYSVIVLQHNPPPVIASILETILGNLNPNGIGFFQVPTYKAGYKFNLKSYLAPLADRSRMEMHLLPQKEVFRVVEATNCQLLEVREDDAAGGDWVSNTFLVQKRPD